MKTYVINTCKESIPCNPCVDSCKVNAIFKENLVTPPVIDEEKCIACKNCVAQCPGQALYFYTEENDREGTITFPFEFLPLPTADEKVSLLDMEGHVIGKGVVSKVQLTQKYNKTPLLTVQGTIDVIKNTRGIKRSV